MRTVEPKLYPIFERLRKLFFNGYINANAIRKDHDSERLLDILVEGDSPDTMYYPDINYQDDCRSLWDTERHYGRLEKALISDNRKLLDSDPVFRDRILSALRYWVKNDFLNPNWWHNEIGVPRNLADIALAVYEYLPDDVYEGLLSIISRGSLLGNGKKLRSWTGANKIWGASTTLRHAVLIGNYDLLADAVEMASTELDYNFEGIHRDGSFYQHGARLYSGGYGRSFASDISQLAYVLQGTPWQFSKENLDVFAVHVLDGLRNMTQYKSLDYGCVGREFTRPNNLDTGNVRRFVSLLAGTAEMPRHDEIGDYINELDGKSTYIGTKYFNEAAMLSHHSDGIYFGARFIGGKLIGAEICNDEGVLCFNKSYGANTCVMVDGSEYYNISPIWQYDRIPGTTAASETDSELLKYKWVGRPLPNDVYGGIQGNGCGIVFEKEEHDGIVAYASVFAVPGGMVCLGSGVTTDVVRPLVTTVEQSHWQDEVRYDNHSIIHHGIRYTPLCGTEFTVETKEVVGSWQRNSLPESPVPVRGKLFTVTVEHSEENVSGGKTSSYAYMISSSRSDLPKLEILKNDSDVQAIRLEDGTVMAVFYKETCFDVQAETISGKAVSCIII